jgi:hypothetical protein
MGNWRDHLTQNIFTGKFVSRSRPGLHVENGNLVIYRIIEGMIMDHEACVKHQIGKFIDVSE